MKGPGAMAIGSDTRRVLWGALAAIVLLPLLFHAGMILGGREPLAPDTQAVRPLGVWATETQHEMGRVPLWIPYLFSGMPSYGSYIYTPASPFSPLDWVTRPLSGERGLRYYAYMLLGGLAAFAFFRRQGRSIPASAAVALAFVMTPYIPGVIGAGHSTKLKALMHVPLVLLALDVFLDRPGPLATAFLALSVAMLGWANHPQILYYAAIIAVLYAIGRILAERAVWTGGRLLLAAIWGIVGLFVAFLLIAEPTLAVREYAPYSVRGATEEGGAEWRYATDWSFAPRETISFLFPEFYGLQGETYFGPLPFTQSTHYFGILMLLAVVFGLARARTPRSWIWLVISLVILFVGFGRYLPILYGPFYKLLPYFNRFRVPSMFYSLLPLTLGYLAAVGIDALIRPGPAARSAPAARSGKPAAPAAARGGAKAAGPAQPRMARSEAEQARRNWLLAGAVLVAIGLIVLLVGLLGSGAGPIRPGEETRIPGQQLQQIARERWTMRVDGIARSLLLVGLFLAAVPIARRMRPALGASLLGLLLIADVWIVGAKFENLGPREQVASWTQTTPEIEYLRQQPKPFRILPIDEFGSNRFVAFDIGTIGGYQPAKLRLYQDLIDEQLLTDPRILSMLNVRYLLTRNPIQHPAFTQVADGVYEYRDTLPRAWFVSGWRALADGPAVVRGLSDEQFDPASIALFERAGAPQGLPETGLPARSANFEGIDAHHVRITVGDGDGPGLLVVSEIYYAPGWRATIDGAPAEILKANHVLRAVVVPAGPHTIEMAFRSTAYEAGIRMNRIGAALIVLLVIAGVILRRRGIVPEEPAPSA